MSNDISDKDKKDWQRFISNKEKLYDKDLKNILKKNTKSRSLDLHGYTLDDANKLVEKFINKSHQEKINKLIIVTGKGLHSQTENDPNRVDYACLDKNENMYVLITYYTCQIPWEQCVLSKIERHKNTSNA